jgi:hypothetical protein
VRGKERRCDDIRYIHGVVWSIRSDEDNDIQRREYMTSDGVRITEQKSGFSGVGRLFRERVCSGSQMKSKIPLFIIYLTIVSRKRKRGSHMHIAPFTMHMTSTTK